ncbi:putative bifunctional diguanylate cyclase/phosphodiesterase [Paraglaciecola arctica]|uniref:Diguanylate cyclase/phosphodiesterase n=1 Tax=Paraglaciecola arctica BSs20135 TaxID=493475 RepID=K6Y523_9ALTE|nr:EAL domain-containing protein [Paraglaciecola arctica]GAC19076.1 diguanylate cyclase/phosphodiesterase [Paraglaciecola arctica BSs20135]
MDASLLTALGLLDCVVFRRLSSAKFEVLYRAGNWLDELLPEIVDTKVFCFAQNSAYLEDFLIDAENLWQANKNGRIESGLWSEQLSTQLVRLEASAVVANKQNYLIVSKLEAKYRQKQQTLQIARELLLSSDKISAQHDYLHSRLEELLSQPNRTLTAQQPIAQALTQTDLAVAILDADLHLLNSNPALRTLFDDTNIKIGLPPDKLLLELFRTQYPECERIFSTASSWTGEIYWLNPPQQGKWLKLSIHPIKNDEQRVQNWLFSVSDVTQVKYLLKRNEKLTHFDALTNLPNRQYFWQQLESKIQQNRPFYLLYIDIKQFKRINELHGHVVGDEVIKDLSKRLNAITHVDDMIARIGGTEFAVIMQLNHLHTHISSQDQNQCIKFAEELIRVSCLPFYLSSGLKCEVGLNVGATAFPADTNSAEELMKYADLAVYSAKKKAVSSIEFYSKELIDASRKRIDMENSLRSAVENQEFELFLQPMLDLASGKIIKAEALIRWHHPNGYLVPPDEFIPLAEQTGLIIPIGKWVVTEACAILKRLAEKGEEIKLSINLSPRQVNDRQLFEFIKESVTKAQVNPHHLELELTEGVLIDNYDKVYYLLDEVRKLGMSVSIDDFGTGYSSLSYLQKLPIDRLKIDRSFINEINENSQDSDGAIILAVIAMAHSLKLEVIAEGVETVLQRDFLKLNNCNIAQGYLFSRPVPYDEFCDLLEGQKNKN